MRNLRDLKHLEARLPRDCRGQMQVRGPMAAPSIQLYRSGERIMVSFYPVNQLSGEGQQLEVRITSPPWVPSFRALRGTVEYQPFV